jgi:hypothetical protein
MVDAGANSLDILQNLTGKNVIDKLSNINTSKMPGLFRSIPGAGQLARALKYMDGLSRKYTLEAIAAHDPALFQKYIALERKLKNNGFDLTKLTPEEIKLKADMYRLSEVRSVGMGRATEPTLWHDPMGIEALGPYFQVFFGQLKKYDVGQLMNCVEMYREFKRGIANTAEGYKKSGKLMQELKESMTKRNDVTFRTPMDIFYYTIGQTAMFGLKGTVGLGLIKYGLMGAGMLLTYLGTMATPFVGDDKKVARGMIKYGNELQLVMPKLESALINYINKTGGSPTDYIMASLLSGMTYGIPTATFGTDISVKGENRWFDATPMWSFLKTCIKANQIARGETEEPIERVIQEIRATVIPTLFNQIYRAQQQRYSQLRNKSYRGEKLSNEERKEFESLIKYWKTPAGMGPLLGGKDMINLSANAHPHTHTQAAIFFKGVLGLSDVKDTRTFAQTSISRIEERNLESYKNSLETIIMNKASRLPYEEAKELINTEIKKVKDREGIDISNRKLQTRLENTLDSARAFIRRMKSARRSGLLEQKMKIWKKNGDVQRYVDSLRILGKNVEADDFLQKIEKY